MEFESSELVICPRARKLRFVIKARFVDDGAASIDFGAAFFEADFTEEFSIRNVGTQPLNIGTITLPDGFALETPPSSKSLESGDSTSFTVSLDTSELKSRAGEIVVESNDEDEASFNFNIAADVIASKTLDNGQAGFLATGEWTHWQSEGFSGDMHYSVGGTGADTASWTFQVTPGDYSVAATWTTLANRATNSPFTILDGQTPLTTVQVNQKLPPDDFTEQGKTCFPHSRF